MSDLEIFTDMALGRLLALAEHELEVLTTSLATNHIDTIHSAQSCYTQLTNAEALVETIKARVAALEPKVKVQ